MDEVLNNPDIPILKERGDIKVHYGTDTTLVHRRRILPYRDIYYNPHVYNVDTRVNTRLKIGYRILELASMGGIDINVKGAFQDMNNKHIYFLDSDSNVSEITR